MHGRLAAMIATVVPMLLITLAVGCSSDGTSSSAPRAKPNLHSKILFLREDNSGAITILTAQANGTDVRRISDSGEFPASRPTAPGS
jgi:hypothetical protein